MPVHPNEELMRQAVEEARRAGPMGNYQVGAIIVDTDLNVVSSSHTMLHSDFDPTAHAEIVALRAATRTRRNRYLEDCYLYSTLEPCPMCTAACIWAKLKGIVFGATMEDAVRYSTREGRFTWRQIEMKSRCLIENGTPELELEEAFLRDECVPLLATQRS